jgi:hypothetical protein
VVDYIEDAMPRTPTLNLTSITTVLSADQRDSRVPTSIVFAKLLDLIRYMRDEDPFGLLFARNIRLKLRHSRVNSEITSTFIDEPTEFVFSNNGITMLCEHHFHDPGTQQLRIENPRVVNGSQTLHSVRDAASASATARVMVRIIQVPPPARSDFTSGAQKRRDIIEKIAMRTNFQNPIRKWNLISNDTYQHELARFFRKKKLYYERRDDEWTERLTELKAAGIQRGPHIKPMLQLIASYYWNRKRLGPVVAKRGFEQIFEEARKRKGEITGYEIIKVTSPELVYQIYLLGEILSKCLKELGSSRVYIEELASYVRFVLF